MKNTTKILIKAAASQIYEAFIDPEKIGNFWFSSSSERWEEGKTIILSYEEYNAEGPIHILKMEENKLIVFEWGEKHTVTIKLTEQNEAETIVEVTEDGFDEQSENFVHHLIDNKEGWVYMLTCLKGYLENGINTLRSSLVK